MLSKDSVKVNMNDIAIKGYFSMLSATIEEISEYFKILQTKDSTLGRRVMRYGCDEELFSKWTETLQTCAMDVGLSLDPGLFDEMRDLQDFNQDIKDLQTNLRVIVEQNLGLGSSTEKAVEASQLLLDQQQFDRTQYKTQMAVKAEKQFDAKLIRYETVIGIGGFGEVWKAKYRGDYVAIKKVPAKALGLQAIASLKMEAEFMKKLSHPRIVSCLGILESEGNYCMVMELCVNGSLGAYMINNLSQNVSQEKRTEFALDIATGMNYLHKLGVIHRDLKLGNVVLDKHDRAKITDFGLSVVKSATQTSVKLDSCGTPQYMAPESFGLVPIFSTKSDVYAFAIVLWELNHWRAAYLNVSVVEIRDAIKDGDRLPIDTAVPPEIKRLIVECWDDNPKRRPTFSMIAERLANPAITLGSQASSSLLQVSTKTKSRKKTVKRVLSSNQKSGNEFALKKNNFRILVALLVLLVLILIGGGIGVYVYVTSNKVVSSPTSPVVPYESSTSVAPAEIPSKSSISMKTLDSTVDTPMTTSVAASSSNPTATSIFTTVYNISSTTITSFSAIMTSSSLSTSSANTSGSTTTISSIEATILSSTLTISRTPFPTSTVTTSVTSKSSMDSTVDTPMTTSVAVSSSNPAATSFLTSAYNISSITITSFSAIMTSSSLSTSSANTSGSTTTISSIEATMLSSTQTISRTPFPTSTVTTLVQDFNLLYGVDAMTLDENENIYVTTTPTVYPFDKPGYPLIYKISQGSTPSISLIANLSTDGQGFLVGEQGICYYNQSLYVPRLTQLTKIDLGNGNQVTRFAGSGVAGTTTDGANSSAVFNNIIHCTTDKSGNIYVNEFSSSILRKVNQTGYVSSVVTTPDGQPHSFLFNGTKKLIYPASGVLNAYDALIKSLDMNSLQVSILAGNTSQPPYNEGPSLDVRIMHPQGVALDELGNLYYSQNNGISKINTTNWVSIFAGSNDYYTVGYTDSTGLNSRFNTVRYLWFDSKGRILAVDQSNCAIRVINW